jgi:NAD(P)-dependent dehydrogenase (short-subunit alcohol dehydrogenase family)
VGPDPLRGRVCVVTGATSGIGLETARGLAAQGATVVLGARDAQRGEEAQADIHATTGSGDLHVALGDFARLRDVRTFAEGVLGRFPRVHVLVNNAGVLMGRRVVTEDGLELTFQVNYLSHVLLTRLLLGRLGASAPSRIVNVASEASRRGALNLDDLQLEQGWTSFRAYTRSKLANIAFTYELARRLEGTGVTVNAAHPGLVSTGWTRHAAPVMRAVFTLAKPFVLSASKGADTIVWLAGSPDVEGRTGGYYHKRGAIRSNPAAYDEAAQRRLWDLSERLAARSGPLPRVPDAVRASQA